MKTLIIFVLGITFGLYGAHYYDTSKTEYFDSLYSQYSMSHQNQLTAKQFEKQWLSELPWCFSTPTDNICNSATACATDNNSHTAATENQLVDWHQKFVVWYPSAKNTIYTTFGQIEEFFQERLNG